MERARVSSRTIEELLKEERFRARTATMIPRLLHVVHVERCVRFAVRVALRDERLVLVPGVGRSRPIRSHHRRQGLGHVPVGRGHPQFFLVNFFPANFREMQTRRDFALNSWLNSPGESQLLTLHVDLAACRFSIPRD